MQQHQSKHNMLWSTLVMVRHALVVGRWKVLLWCMICVCHSFQHSTDHNNLHHGSLSRCKYNSLEHATTTRISRWTTATNENVHCRTRSSFLGTLKDDNNNNHNDDDDDDNDNDQNYSNHGSSIEHKTFLSSHSLESIGWNNHFEHQRLFHANSDHVTAASSVPARVIEVRSNGIRVVGPDLSMNNLLIPPLSERKRNHVVVGDWVLLRRSSSSSLPSSLSSSSTGLSQQQQQQQQHESWIIHCLLKRKSILQRQAPGPARKVQLLAANLDTVFLVTSFNQDFNVARLERFIAMAFEANIAPVIVLTKRDIYQDAEADEYTKTMLDTYVTQAKAIARDMMRDDHDDVDDDHNHNVNYHDNGIPVLELDARGNEPKEKLAHWCQPGQTVAFLGSSGVGKSTLVNSLCGSCVAPTAEIHHDSGQGRHTTTRRQLFFLSNGCAVIDTPGLRELQLLHVSHGLDQVFSDLVKLSTQCRFKDCRHDGEPGCAVEAAVDQGVVDGDRVARWQKLVMEQQEQQQNDKIHSSSKTVAATNRPTRQRMIDEEGQPKYRKKKTKQKQKKQGQ